jgi:ribosomal protein L6P/L9E
MDVRLKKYIIEIPTNIQIIEKQKFLELKNIEKSYFLKIKLIKFLQINYTKNKIIINLIDIYKNFKFAQILLITFSSKLKHQIKGISELYKGVINLKGLGYSVHVTKQLNKYHLFFRFGFKDTYKYIMPEYINIENFETAKIHLNISTYSIELLKQVQRNIQRFRIPKAYKLQGIYLDYKYPKVKKFVK